MKIAVLGSGVVGKTIADKLVQLGHSVVIGTRDPAATAARSEPGMMGDPPMTAWLADHPTARLATFSAASAEAEMVILATSGRATLEAIGLVGPANVEGKIVVDITNPLDFSRGMPPSLFICGDDSLGEQVQRALPGAKVVKTLNTVNANLMVDPKMLADGQHTMFVSGEDAAAKATVTRLLQSFGWTDVMDLGGIENARGTEMAVALWVRLFVSTQNPMFGFRVVR